ncbi:hypothetical protein AB0I84_28660 [Streptomyces spectabilis]|uniref:hypothetical protein n=1 Tax=Streptomyces spectabilis TaxID=68270 RepID=UPI0033F65BB2
MIKRVAVGVAAAALCAFGGGVAVADAGGNGAHATGSAAAHGPAAGSDVAPGAWELSPAKHSVVAAGWLDKPRPGEL